MQQVGHLQKLHEKYFDKGLRIIAVTAEPAGTVESAVVKQRGGKYWMASDPARTTMGRYTTRGRGVPACPGVESALEAGEDPCLPVVAFTVETLREIG